MLEALAILTPRPPPLSPLHTLHNNLNDPLHYSFSYILASSTPDPSFFLSIRTVPYPRLLPPQRRRLNTPPTHSQSTHTLIHTLRVNPIGPLHVSRSISPLDSPPQRVSLSCLWGWTAFFPFFIRST